MSVPVLLIVEDDEMTRELLCDVLRLQGHWHVVEMADGSELRTSLQTVKPDLVLLDISLPGMSGIDAYRLIRSNETTVGDVPVFFVTADPALLKHKTLPGTFKVIEKPFHITDLLNAVADALVLVRRQRKIDVQYAVQSYNQGDVGRP